MRAGLLSEWLVVEQRISTPNPHGGTIESWVPGFEDWGEVQWLSELSSRFILRYRTFDDNGTTREIAPNTHRIFWNRRRWTITNAIPDRRHEHYVLDCDGGDLLEATHLESADRDRIDGMTDIRPHVVEVPLDVIAAELATMELGEVELGDILELIRTTLTPADIRHLAGNPEWIGRILALARQLAAAASPTP